MAIYKRLIFYKFTRLAKVGRKGKIDVMSLFPFMRDFCIQNFRNLFLCWFALQSFSGLQAERARDWGIPFEGKPGHHRMPSLMFLAC
jgi:hypothetical protein